MSSPSPPPQDEATEDNCNSAVAAAVAGPQQQQQQQQPPQQQQQPPPQPPSSHGPPSTLMADYQEPPDTKEGIEELCPVCGDKVSGYHYGLLTCESCKGFFKRTVQNKKVYTCVAERNCHIDKSQRKRCPFCRFQKCLDVGMKLEAVRADRMRGGRNKFGPMYKRDRARKLQMLRQKQMAQQTRPPCQLNPAELAAANNGGGGGCITTLASTLTYVPCATPGGPPPLYTTGGSQHQQQQPPGPQQQHITIKQEIQIPQLSSSTASPDSSSSSPLPNSTNNPHHHHHHHHHHPHLVGLPQPPPPPPPPPSATATTSSPTALHSPTTAGTWVGGPRTPGTPTSSTPSPHNASPTATAVRSPEAFHYDGAGGVIPLSAATPAPQPAPPVAAVAAAVGPGGGKLPAIIREFQQNCLDDKEWQSQLFGLLQSQTYNQCEVDLFELMCKVLDQSLFAQVDWARNSPFFKDLKVDDQMKLLQYSWSEMLILDHIHHRLHNSLPDETTLPNGQKFDLLTLAVLGLSSVVDQFNELSVKMQELKLDSVDYLCLKFLLLLNPEVRGLMNRKHIHEAHEQVKQALLDYTLSCYNQVQDKFNKMMMLLPEVHMLSLRGEEFLYYKHLNGSAPTQTLLMEMLHAKKK